MRSDAFWQRQPFDRVMWCSLAARWLPVLEIARGGRAEAHGIVAAIVAAPRPSAQSETCYSSGFLHDDGAGDEVFEIRESAEPSRELLWCPGHSRPNCCTATSFRPTSLPLVAATFTRCGTPLAWLDLSRRERWVPCQRACAAPAGTHNQCTSSEPAHPDTDPTHTPCTPLEL